MMSFLTGPFSAVVRHRDLLARTTASEMRHKYAGSLMGVFWLLVSPIVLMSLYALIYLVIFRVQPVAMSQTDYVLYIFSGLIPFLSFMEALNTGSSSLSLNKSVLLNTVFPAELVPVRAVLAAQGTAVVGLTIVVILALVLGKASPALALVPVIWLLLVLFTTGLVWVFSLASLVLRDIQHALVFLSMILLIVSPIAYTLDMAPGPMKALIYANPLSYFLIALHEVVVFGRLPAVEIMCAVVLIGLTSLGAGYWVFQKAKQVFFDYA